MWYCRKLLTLTAIRTDKARNEEILERSGENRVCGEKSLKEERNLQRIL